MLNLYVTNRDDEIIDTTMFCKYCKHWSGRFSDTCGLSGATMSEYDFCSRCESARDGYFDVTQTTEDELDQLRDDYYWQMWGGDEKEELQAEYIKVYGEFPEYIADIPDEAVYKRYDGISFVDEDFFCNCE